MPSPDSLTLREILRQPATWQQAIDVLTAMLPEIARLLAAAAPDLYIFTGCGTSYYLSIVAAGLFQEITGSPARAVPASELILSQQTHIPPGARTALFAFSRSGETTETLTALRLHKKRGLGPTVALVCRATCAMAGVADLTISLPAADDKSVVMTSSFTTMGFAVQRIAAALAKRPELVAELDRLPERLRGQLEGQRAFGERHGRDLSHERFIYLGMGPFFGLALEGMLKLKEMTQVPCEAYSPLEFRHGPISIVEPGTTAILLASDRATQQELDVLQDIARLGGRTLRVTGSTEAAAQATAEYEVGADLGEWLRTLLYTPLLQCLAYYRALALGLDPDRPQHLTQVVTLDDRSLV